MSQGILYGVGVGPGDPELLTLKAVRVIKEADTIVLPSKDRDNCVAYQIARQAVPSLEKKDFLMISMPMTKNKGVLKESHQEGAKAVEALLKQGKSLAFLTLGDPTIYSTFLYIQSLIGKHHYRTEIISGIPSFCAAAAACCTGLAVNEEPFHVIPSSYPLEHLLEFPGTKVLMKAGKQMAAVKKQLKDADLSTVMVENCGMENQHIYHSLDEIPDQSSYYSLIIARNTETNGKIKETGSMERKC